MENLYRKVALREKKDFPIEDFCLIHKYKGGFFEFLVWNSVVKFRRVTWQLFCKVILEAFSFSLVFHSNV